MFSQATDSSPECIIQRDENVIGIGVRVVIYILSLAQLLFSSFSVRSFVLDYLDASLAISSLLLFLYLVIISAIDQLDFFHSLCILQLLDLVKVFTHMPSRGSSSSILHSILNFLTPRAGVAFTFCMVYVFATSKSFGSTPECNSQVKLVFMFVNIPATLPALKWLVIISSFVGRYITSGMLFAPLEPNIIPETRAFRSLGNFLSPVYIITMLELMLRQNNLAPNSGIRSYGQILAIIVLVGTVAVCVWGCISRNSDGDYDDEGEEDELEEASVDEFAKYLVCSVLDLGWCALAGVAAASAGAHANGTAITKHILQLGALAGVIKSGVSNCYLLYCKSSAYPGARFLMSIAGVFGVMFILTSAIAQRAFHEVPNALSMAALAASAPLLLSHSLLSSTDGQPGGGPLALGFDALGGYTFARVAQNHGMRINEDRIRT
ncbi:hypothetical protein F5884DRAFT_789716 [Xylogone sp. PMI_703]|nr:hypothetical protein F5884DRAFT_789716 [Xylogone sp. PMI_703]